MDAPSDARTGRGKIAQFLTVAMPVLSCIAGIFLGRTTWRLLVEGYYQAGYEEAAYTQLCCGFFLYPLNAFGMVVSLVFVVLRTKSMLARWLWLVSFAIHSLVPAFELAVYGLLGSRPT